MSITLEVVICERLWDTALMRELHMPPAVEADRKAAMRRAVELALLGIEALDKTRDDGMPMNPETFIYDTAMVKLCALAGFREEAKLLIYTR